MGRRVTNPVGVLRPAAVGRNSERHAKPFLLRIIELGSDGRTTELSSEIWVNSFAIG